MKKLLITTLLFTGCTNYYRTYYNCDGKIINTTKN